MSKRHLLRAAWFCFLFAVTLLWAASQTHAQDSPFCIPVPYEVEPYFYGDTVPATLGDVLLDRSILRVEFRHDYHSVDVRRAFDARVTPYDGVTVSAEALDSISAWQLAQGWVPAWEDADPIGEPLASWGVYLDPNPQFAYQDAIIQVFADKNGADVVYPAVWSRARWKDCTVGADGTPTRWHPDRGWWSVPRADFDATLALLLSAKG